MKKIGYLLFFLVPVAGFATQNSWTKKASFVMEFERGVAFSIGGFGYVGTGQDSANLVHNEFWQYDPVLNTWTQVAAMPAIGRRNAIAFVVNNKRYVGTGCDAAESLVGNNLKDLWEYDPVTNSWTVKANYPGASRKQSLPTTGTSLAIERIIDLMDLLDLYPPELTSTVVQVLVTVFDETTQAESLRLAERALAEIERALGVALAR